MAAVRHRPGEHPGIDLRKPDPRLVWARTARASSEYSSSYAARTACGLPTIYPEGGDLSPSWLASNDDTDPWIELSFPETSTVRAILVCETCGAGAVREVRDLDSKKVLYRAEPFLLDPAREARLLVIPVDPPSAMKRLRIAVAPYSLGSEYKEIDAVALSSVPFEELAQPYVPPPKPEELLVRMKGTLLGVSVARPLVHALLASKSGVTGRSTGRDVKLRRDDGTVFELGLDRATVYGGRVSRHSGPWKDLVRHTPLLAELFGVAACAPDAHVTAEIRRLEREGDVEVAGELVETRSGGFRDVEVVRRLDAVAIARPQLAGTAFLAEGLAGHTRIGERPARPDAKAHPLRGWSIGMSITTLAFSALLWAAIASEDVAAIALATGVTTWHAALTLDLLGARVAVPVLVQGDVFDRRPPWSRHGWTYFASWIIGFVALLAGGFTVGPVPGSGPILVALSLGGGVALARLVVALRAYGPTHLALGRALWRSSREARDGAWARFDGSLSDATVRRTERYVAKAIHLGTDHYTDAKGQRQSHDRFEVWNERHISVRSTTFPDLFLPDGRLVRAGPQPRSTDLAMVADGHSDIREGDYFASFVGVHGAGDPATFMGRVQSAEPGEITLDHALVVFGPPTALRRRLAAHGATWVGLAALVLVGLGALVELAIALAGAS